MSPSTRQRSPWPRTWGMRSHPDTPGRYPRCEKPTVYEGFSFFVGVWGSLGYLHWFLPSESFSLRVYWCPFLMGVFDGSRYLIIDILNMIPHDCTTTLCWIVCVSKVETLNWKIARASIVCDPAHVCIYTYFTFACLESKSIGCKFEGQQIKSQSGTYGLQWKQSWYLFFSKCEIAWKHMM